MRSPISLLASMSRSGAAAGRDRKQDHRHRCEEHGHGHHEALAHQQHEETGHGDHPQPGGRIQKWPRYWACNDVNVTKQMARGSGFSSVK